MEQRKLGLVKLLGSLFKNFPKLMLTNLLFVVPFAVFSVLFYWLGTALNFLNIITLSLTVIPIMPFFAGVTMVTRNMVRGDNKIPVVSLFFSGIKENGLKFLLHGIVLYVAIIFSYFSITMYAGLGSQNPIFYSVMALSILISVAFLFTFFNLPLMTVTFDLSLKDIYKNCALMSFGELKSNFFALLGVVLLGVFCLSFLIVSGTALWVLILTAVFVYLLIPSVMSFLINYSVYKGMMSLLLAKERRQKEIEKEILYKKNPALKKQEEDKRRQEDLADFADIEIDESANGDEYIFHNGKMIKRSLLIKQKKEAGESVEKKEK